MRYLTCFLMLVGAVCCPATAEQIKVGDLYKRCTSSDQLDKTACSFYILGLFEGASVGAGTVREKSGFGEARDKPFCVPEGLTSLQWNSSSKLKWARI
jgi:hypothetical protein